MNKGNHVVVVTKKTKWGEMITENHDILYLLPV